MLSLQAAALLSESWDGMIGDEVQGLFLFYLFNLQLFLITHVLSVVGSWRLPDSAIHLEESQESLCCQEKFKVFRLKFRRSVTQVIFSGEIRGTLRPLTSLFSQNVIA